MEVATNAHGMPSVRAIEASERTFMTRVFSWMGGGLLLTALTAWYVGRPEVFVPLFGGGMGLFWALVIVEVILVFAVSAAAAKLKPGLAAGLFVAYSLINGVTMSVLFLAYTQASILSAFLAAGGTFGASAVYGAVTKKDLTKFGSLCAMGLFGIVIASVVNLFVGSDRLSWVISYVGVFVFIGLTAWDIQKLKAIHKNGMEGDAADRSMAITGALALYLDFINLFIFLLRILGKRRN